MLGGALSPDVSHARNTVALNEAAERLTAVAELASRYPDARIIFSGGSGALVYDDRPEAEFALRLLETLGVAPGRVVPEDKSRNTVENARFSRDLPSRSRASAGCSSPPPTTCRVRSGFSARPASRSRPIRSTGAPAASRDALRPFPTLGDGLRRTDTAVREWVGLVAYWLNGHSSELFPGPIRRGECDRAGGGLDNCRP